MTPERRLEINRKACLKYARTAKGRQARRRYALRRRYGHTSDPREGPDARCCICGSMRRLCIDHEHGTRLVRGLLCSTCNAAIGMLHDSPVVLRMAARYLDEARA